MAMIRRMVRSAALTIGPIGRLVAQRDALLVENTVLAMECQRLRDQAAVEQPASPAEIAALREERDVARLAVQTLRSQPQAPPAAVAPEPASAAYERWFLATFGTYGTAPNTHPATSWHPGTRWGGRMLEAMSKPEGEYAESLLAEIAEKNIPGAIVEFGVFDGDWMERLITSCETIGLQREVWGFDSFEGLPPPSPTEDLDCWAEGDFAASLESVAERLGTAYRPHVKLVKGWFSDTLPTAAVQGITQIAYARIDCDLYGPSVECLDYLTTRLSDQAILVLDDWTYNLAKGETMSFMQWAERNQQFRFEFLCFNSVGHFYVRVHRR